MATAGAASVPSIDPSLDEDSKILSVRGRKRHKCSLCGNIARSRCPFHACKGCCVKAQNPCKVHVMKAGVTGENTQGYLVTPPLHLMPIISGYVRHPLDSFRTRTFKPIGPSTRKEAAFVNIWRFHKLKDYLDGLQAAEDEAFDRYMQNALLLTEIFISDSKSLGLNLLVEPPASGVDMEFLTDALQVRLRSNSKRKEAHRQRLKCIIDRSLQKLYYQGEQGDEELENEDFYTGARRVTKRIKIQSIDGKRRLKKMDAFNSLLEKMKHTGSKEDFDSCLKACDDSFLSSQEADLMAEEMVSSPQQEEKIDLHEDGKGEVALDLVFDTYHRARVDAHGSLKAWCKVDMEPQSLGSLTGPSFTLLSL